MRKLAVKLMLQNLRKEQKDRHLTLCMGFVEQLQDDHFLDHISLVMKHGIINMILKLNASPWCADQRIPLGQRSHRCHQNNVDLLLLH
jgi:hypothetical protein